MNSSALKGYALLFTERLGKVVTETSNRDGIVFQCGGSRIEVDTRGLVRGRKEGGSGSRLDYPLGYVGDLDGFVAWALDVLEVGRTIEYGAGCNLRDLRGGWPYAQFCDMAPDEILHHVDGSPEGRAWDLSPDYQRGHVWTRLQSEKFVGHLLEGGPVPPIYVQRYESAKNAPPEIAATYYDHAEVVDGQQRIRAIVSWVRGEVDALLSDGRRIRYVDTNEIDRRFLPSLKIGFIDVPRKTRLEFYLKLNRGGTVHTDDEIDRVRDLLAKETT